MSYNNYGKKLNKYTYSVISRYYWLPVKKNQMNSKPSIDQIWQKKINNLYYIGYTCFHNHIYVVSLKIN